MGVGLLCIGDGIAGDADGNGDGNGDGMDGWVVRVMVYTNHNT